MIIQFFCYIEISK